jgi:histidine triad (HIT) family protein
MSTIFTKIISGEIPSHKIAEDDRFLAFLDINPLVKGHTLVIPKIENDFIFDLDDNTLAGLIIFAKKIAKALDKAIVCKRVGVLVIGTEVRHTHIHLIPFNDESEMNIKKQKLQLTSEELNEISEKIKKEL